MLTALSLLILKKKKIIWTFQDVIHDLWDFDLSAPPILADIKIENFIIPSVIVTTKTGRELASIQASHQFKLYTGLEFPL